MVKKHVNTLSRHALIPVFALSLIACGGSETTTNTEIVEIDTSQPISDWQLVWADEFDGASLDTSSWNYEINCAGGGNNEQQCYTDSPENLFLADGVLNIVALPAEAGAEKAYTSARINTRGKMDFTYGRVEMRAKLPRGQGSWPAFWMLPSDYEYGEWPKSGEVDIMEAVNLGAMDQNGNPERHIHGTLHYGNAWPNNDSSGKEYLPPDGLNPADDFNTYAIEWQEGEFRWYMNGYLYATQRQSQVRYNSTGEAIGLRHKGWYTPQFNPVTGEPEVTYGPEPFDQPFHLLLNLAVGGDWPENVNEGGIDATAFENGQTYQIDYVRVYECSVDPATGKGCETIRPGYDDEEDALVEGKAPSPTPPAPPTATPITIFADGENPDWPLWDCCGGTTPQVVMDDDATYGSVAEFEILDNAGTVLGFNSRIGESEESYNAGAMIGIGSLKFDMKVVSPTGGATTWLLKVEADGNTSSAQLALNESVEGLDPVVGEWQSYTFPIQQLSDLGLDVGSIDVIMIFPEWGTGGGAKYRVDNVRIEQDGAVASPQLNLFEDDLAEGWVVWDCCGGTMPTIEEDEAPYGNTVEFRINDNNGTVLGITSRSVDGGAGEAFDASAILVNGVVQFDMKLVNATTADTTWLLKVESDSATTAVEVALSTSQEDVAPVEGEWQTYTFALSDLADAGLDVSMIDVLMIFPTWQTGAGAVYRVDNFKIYDPTASGAPSGPVLQGFVDGVNPDWPLWDCCGGTTPTVEMDDAEHGATAEFRINDNNGTVLGFNSRNGESELPFDASSILTTGVITFEMKVDSMPAGDPVWLMKLESDNTTTEVQVELTSSQEGAAPVEGQWQTYTFDLLSLSDQGLDVSAIDVIMIFPAWGTGAGAVYRVDNLFIGNPSDITGITSGGNTGIANAYFTVFADQVNEQWPLWDCCGGTTPTVEMDDAQHGATAEFRINANTGTVMGFYSRDDGVPFDASSILAAGQFQFEMKLISEAEGDVWLMKMEADGNTSAVELDLTDSLEGLAPVVGQWQTYTFDLTQLQDGGIDVSAIDVIMVFPAWGTGNGAVYRLDNVVFLQ